MRDLESEKDQLLSVLKKAVNVQLEDEFKSIKYRIDQSGNVEFK